MTGTGIGAFDGFDRISLTGIEVFGHHGVLAQEQRDGQLFVVDVVLHAEIREAGRTDDLSRTIDYSAVATDIEECVSGERVDLIETLAQCIADRLLEMDRVAIVEVTVHKPHAPIAVTFADVAVSIVRVR